MSTKDKQQTKFKNYTIRFSSLAVFGFLGLSIISPSQARTATTGSITLSGVIPASTAIVVTGQGSYNSLDLTTSQSNLQVATVREINNSANGYSVTLTSSNSGQLKNGNHASIPYTAKYNNQSVTLSSSPVQVTNEGPSQAVTNIVKNLSISYTGVDTSNMTYGSYSDTLTFTISAN